MEGIPQRVVPILVDLSARGNAPPASREMASRYEVSTIPRLVLVDSTGKVVELIKDYDPEAILSKLPAPSAGTSGAPPPAASSGWGLLTLAAVVIGLLGVVAAIGGVMWKMGMFSSED